MLGALPLAHPLVEHQRQPHVLALFLDQFDFKGRDKNYLHFLADVEHEDFQGKKLGVFHHDELMGDLSSAPSIFEYET